MVRNKEQSQQGLNENRRGGRGDQLNQQKQGREAQREDELQENRGKPQKATPNRTDTGKK